MSDDERARIFCCEAGQLSPKSKPTNKEEKRKREVFSRRQTQRVVRFPTTKRDERMDVHALFQRKILLLIMMLLQNATTTPRARVRTSTY